MSNSAYEYGLSLTSQFYFCSLPLRLDTYSSCQFDCSYCFAKARGGRRGDRALKVFEARSLRDRLTRVERGHVRSVVDEFLAHRQPLHFGGMSDPFMPAERKTRTTLDILKILAEFHYPTVISTKSALVAERDYVSVLRTGRFLVQLSVSSTDDDLIRVIDKWTPVPSDRFKAMTILSNAGVPTSCRIQPILPTREHDAHGVVVEAAAAGAFHVGVEHLKLPIERSWRGAEDLSRALGRDMREYFKERHATRVGREWVLPLVDRLPLVLALRELTHDCGMSFGAADTDLLLLSDGRACCAGLDALRGFENFNTFTYPEVIRSATRHGDIEIKSLVGAWRPQGSVSRSINSNSRLRLGPTGVEDYVKANWNGSGNGVSPLSFAGVLETGRQDCGGFNIYSLDPTFLKALTAASEER